MKILFAVALTLALAGCQCGPGVTCKTNEPCDPWGVCGANGYCVSRASQGDGGVPRAVVPTTQVDLALVGCGAMKSQKLTITNAGTGTLTFSTSLVNATNFSVSPAMGELGGEQTAELTVTGTVPASTVANTELVGVLTLNVNEAGRGKIDIPLKLKSQGVTLTLAPAVVAFGSTLIGDAPQTVPVTIENVGNLAASLMIGKPTDDQFSISVADAGLSVTVAPGMKVAGLEATFAAKRITPASTFAALTVAEPVCGSSVVTIPLSGRGQSGVLELPQTEVVFGADGRVDCGSTAAPKTFVIRNTGNASFSWLGSLAKGGASPFQVSPSSGQIFSGADAGVTLTVTALPIPATASTMADAFGDVFTISTSISGDPGHTVNLRQTANGAVLSFSSPTVDFGLVSLGETARSPVSVINAGNAGANVSFSSSNPKFGFEPLGSLAADAGSSNPRNATFKPDASVGLETGELAMALTDGGVLCAPLPPALAMSGRGSTGSVSYSPVGLDFGAVNCGTTGLAQTVTFKNVGNQSYTLTPTLGLDAGSPYTLSMNPGNGVVVSDGGTLVITVQPRPIPTSAPVTNNLFGDTLTVVSNVSGDAPHLIPLRMTARGAIFGISTQSLPFGSVAVGSVGSAQFTIDNTGNAPGTINFAAAQPAIFAVPLDAGIAGIASLVANALFKPTMAMAYTDSAAISVSADTVLCQPLPFSSMALSGTGTTSNALSLSTQSLTFGSGGLVPCGTTAAAKTIRVTNSSSTPLTLTLSLGISDGGSPYTVSGPGVLGANDGGTVTVTPKPRTVPSSTAPDFYSDTLSIQAMGGPVNETQVVALHQTAQGAILTFFPTAPMHFTGSLGSTSSQGFSVNNTGNLAAPYTLNISQPAPPGVFSVTPTSSTVNPNTGQSETVAFNAELLATPRSGSLSITPGAALCGPLPAPIALSAN